MKVKQHSEGEQTSVGAAHAWQHADPAELVARNAWHMKVILKELLVHVVPQTMENSCILLRALGGKLEENTGLSLVPGKTEIKELSHQVVAEFTTGCELGQLAAETLAALRDRHVGLGSLAMLQLEVEPLPKRVEGSSSLGYTMLLAVSMACGDKSRDGCLMKGTFHIADSLRSC